jgi:cytochrome c biogenesis protein CcmG, thiol:disulfide interchange protein DsbE
VIRKAIFIAVLLAACTCVAQSKIGDAAPAFTIKTINGKNVSLSDFKGKVVLVNFWATWCGPCQTEMPRFMCFQREYGAERFQVIGISMDDSDAPVRTFVAKLKVNYPVAMGTAKLAGSYGGILGMPITLLIDRSGNIAKRYEGAVDLNAMQRDIEQLLLKKGKVSEDSHSKQHHGSM